MDYWILNSTIAFLLCITFAGFLIPQILLISFRRNLFDEPDERKIHHGTVPRLGGIAFTPVICFSISLLLGMSILFGDARLLGLMTYNSRSLAFGFCALFLLYVVGMADDLIGIRYRAKFVVQIICSSLSSPAVFGYRTFMDCLASMRFLIGWEYPLQSLSWSM